MFLSRCNLLHVIFYWKIVTCKKITYSHFLLYRTAFEKQVAIAQFCAFAQYFCDFFVKMFYNIGISNKNNRNIYDLKRINAAKAA